MSILPRNVLECIVCRRRGFWKQAGNTPMLLTWWLCTVCCPRMMLPGKNQKITSSIRRRFASIFLKSTHKIRTRMALSLNDFMSMSLRWWNVKLHLWLIVFKCIAPDKHWLRMIFSCPSIMALTGCLVLFVDLFQHITMLLLISDSFKEFLLYRLRKVVSLRFW